MKRSISRSLFAALALSSATLCWAQTAPGVGPTDTPRGATHDCTGMTGSALTTCQDLNRNVNEPAQTGAGTANDCSGMTGAPLLSCRRLNAAEAQVQRSSAGTSEDCGGQVGDALKACRALNGQYEPDAATAGAGTTGANGTQ